MRVCGNSTIDTSILSIIIHVIHQRDEHLPSILETMTRLLVSHNHTFVTATDHIIEATLPTMFSQTRTRQAERALPFRTSTYTSSFSEHEAFAVFFVNLNSRRYDNHTHNAISADECLIRRSADPDYVHSSAVLETMLARNQRTTPTPLSIMEMRQHERECIRYSLFRDHCSNKIVCGSANVTVSGQKPKWSNQRRQW